LLRTGSLNCPWCRRKLIATLHESLSVYRDMIDGQHETDFFADAAVFESSTPQDVPDGAAATLSTFGSDRGLLLEPAIRCPAHARRLGRELVAVKSCRRDVSAAYQLIDRALMCSLAR
jgi:hypothetical protein